MSEVHAFEILSEADHYNTAFDGDTNGEHFFLMCGVDPNSVIDENGATPLFVAAQNGYTKIVSQLIEVGANINHTVVNGATPLSYAASGRNGITASFHDAKTVLALIAAGGNINHKPKYGRTPLDAALHADRKDVALYELTPLFNAARRGNKEIISIMVAAGVNLNQLSQDGLTPLYVAAQCGHAEIVSTLLSAGANINHEDKDRITPLCIAAENGETALYFAAEFGHLDIVSTLLQANADMDIQDNNGILPLKIARRNGYEEIANLLTQRDVFKLHETQCIDSVKTGNTEQIQCLSVGSTTEGANSKMHLAIQSVVP
ncbi:ankyrin repeat domain-containing protein 29-like [Thraustotheca clavata]|uniref:Ankyrin repeat domain-containing protein 29-like n=1 Tax=Thraustotheca clavata TaxID=74557 RepID=A0A1W0A5R7_9STRA|nr:ankyrin repeat domain-containing protein 29-like [Thraustotheca clavata]